MSSQLYKGSVIHWLMLCWNNNEQSSFQKGNNSSLSPIWYVTPFRVSTFCLVQLSASDRTGVCIVLGGWRFVGRFGGGQAAVSRIYVGGKWGNLWHACTHWQRCTCRVKQKLLTHLCRLEEAGAQTHTCTPATKTVTCTQKGRLRKR